MFVSDFNGSIAINILLQEIQVLDDIFEDTFFNLSTVYLKQFNDDKASTPCDIKVDNKGSCPLCQGFISIRRGNKILWNKDYGSHSTIIDWNSLIFNNQCYGAILKVWKWHQSTKTLKFFNHRSERTSRSSAQNDGIENNDYEEEFRTFEKQIKKSSFNSEQLKLNPTDKTYNSVKNNILSLFAPNEVEVNPTESVYLTENWYENISTTPKKSRNKPSSLINANVTDNPNKRNIPNKKRHMSPSKHNFPVQESPFYQKLSKKFNEHSTVHHHYEKESANYLSNKLYFPEVTTQPSNFPTIPRTSSPGIIAPLGYKLQVLNEDLMLILHNTTNWSDTTISTIRIAQLCYFQHCVPSNTAHKQTSKLYN